MEPAPHRIIVIEDNTSDVQLLRHAFDELAEPYILEVLLDGEAAIDYVRKYCREDNPEPCLIVLDLHLPRYDGIEVLRRIKASGVLSLVSVAVLTSGSSPEEYRKVLELGVSLYCQKPLNWDGFVNLACDLFALCKNQSGRTLVASGS